MIKVYGTSTMRIYFSVQVDMTEEEWENLTHHEQDEIVDKYIDYHEACRTADVLEIEIDDVIELK